MVGAGSVRCAKCGVTSKEEPSLTFHRFPLPSMHGPLKAKVWAKYCYPDANLTDELLKNLYKQHKMLCGNHFDNSSFTSSDRKRLNKFAIPTEAQTILAKLRDEQNNPPQEVQEIQIPILNYEMEQASTSTTTVTTLEMNIQHCSANPNPLKESRSKGLLKEIDAKTKQELSPRKLKLYKKCRQNISEIMRLRSKLRATKLSRKSLLKTLSEEDAVKKLMEKKITGPFCLLLQSQMKNVPRKITGRRWTLDEKILALSIYKKSSACYRLLRRLICLPSPSSLKILLNRVPLLCGINLQVMETIKEITGKRALSENICILAFDEMAIRKNLAYNSKLDQIDGYQDHGSQGRTPEIANHALTFMAIGIRKPWKQPIAFYFSADYVTADRLAVLIKEVLQACFSAGLEVIATVSDLDGVNIRAINSLGSTREQPYFNFEGHEIVTILDPPHLLKCFRNNFLKYNIEFTSDIQIEGKQIQGVAKWSHIEEFYQIDHPNRHFVFAPGLTQQHLQPNGKQKMKVRLAAQVLSHSVAAGIYARVSKNELPQEAVMTANVISYMDQLFDAVNGDTPDRKRGKPLLTNMTSTSDHLKHFFKMRTFFTNMKFLGARNKPPSQDGWLRTLNAIERVFKNLKEKNIKTLSVRRLNQDPLENCFGCIRSNCGSNPNPTSVQFIAALKTGILTNLINNNNKNRNCLDDNNNILSDFKLFVNKGCEQATSSTSVIEYQASYSDELDFDIPQCSAEMQACAYVCGFIAKKMGIQCKNCKEVMLVDQDIEVCHLFNLFKEYDDLKRRLQYVQPSFCEMVDNAASIINKYLKDNGHRPNINKNINKICQNLNKDWLKGCEEHSELNFKEIIGATIAICLKRFCILKNREFVEDASKKAFYRKINILKNV